MIIIAVDLSLAVFLKHAFIYILPYTGPCHHRARFFIRKIRPSPTRDKAILNMSQK